jgi:hypothetical protein
MEQIEVAIRMVAYFALVVLVARHLWRKGSRAPDPTPTPPLATPSGQVVSAPDDAREQRLVVLNRQILDKLSEMVEYQKLVIQATYGSIAPLVNASRSEEIQIEEKARSLMRRYPGKSLEECSKIARELATYGGGV